MKSIKKIKTISTIHESLIIRSVAQAKLIDTSAQTTIYQAETTNDLPKNAQIKGSFWKFAKVYGDEALEHIFHSPTTQVFQDDKGDLYFVLRDY